MYVGKENMNELKIVYVGCGLNAIPGAINLDNSPSVFLSHHKVVHKILKKMKFVGEENEKFIEIVKERNIRFGTAQKLPFKENTIDVVYSSHTCEHLYERDLKRFMSEAYRVLKHGGVMRMAIPDLNIFIKQYLIDGDANKFCKNMYMGSLKAPSFINKVKQFIIGDRNHKWMYDGNSMKQYLQENTDFEIHVVPAGVTNIRGKMGIDLREHEDISVYLEGIKR